MRERETGQLSFFEVSDRFIPQPPPEKPVQPERESRIKAVITFSEIEKIIYREIYRVPPRNIFDAATVVGTAIDWFLVPANFVWRYRSNYCFPPELYSEWDLKEVFKSFYPTRWELGKILELLEEHRPNFTGAQNPLYPANLALERRNVKRALVPLWEDIAKKEFKLDSLNLQTTMQQHGNFLLPSDKTASPETISQIGQRIVAERFDALVDDDKNYTYIAKPDCLLTYELEGETFHILVEPDYIKRLRERRKSVRKRNIVAKRIVGDFKDSNRKELGNFTSPFGQAMLVYNWLLLQIGERFAQNQLTRVRLPNRQLRRVFLIPQVVAKPLARLDVQAELEFLQEDGERIFWQMPAMTPELEEFARNTLDKAILLSRQSKLAS